MEERGSSKCRHFEDRGFEDFFSVCFVCQGHINININININIKTFNLINRENRFPMILSVRYPPMRISVNVKSFYPET